MLPEIRALLPKLAGRERFPPATASRHLKRLCDDSGNARFGAASKLWQIMNVEARN
jgi:hypothetical protein